MRYPVPHERRVEELIAAFERQLGRRPEGIAEAPGRVNLIGEHVDYNDGLVLPFAIDRSVMCAWGPSAEQRSELISLNLPAGAQLEPGVRDWAGYVDGVEDVLTDEHSLERVYYGPISFATEGDVPLGAGLSSSAAFEVAVAAAYRAACDLPIGDVELARLCQRAENEYVGVRCGIMDQFASALSKQGHALLIDCRTLAYEHVPLRLAEAGLCVVIANSGVKRELASSAYNERWRECEAAVGVLRERLGRAELASLRDVTAAEMEQVMNDERAAARPPEAGAAGGVHASGTAEEAVALRRARHVVSEIGRVAAAVEALRRDDFEELGRLMGESHRSLREDYEVSSRELDLLVGLATAQEYVVGARLTGAGFGGCTVNIVRADAVDAFERDVIAPYRERTGLAAETYVTAPSDGLRTWRL